MSNAEYRNTVSDLLGKATFADIAKQVSEKFVSETESLGFRNNASFLQVNSVVATQYMDAAETIAAAVRTDPSVLPCTPQAGSEKACATQFIREFGKKAYRRPLLDEEVARYEKVYDDARKSYPFAAGIEWITFSMLQSPHFLNRVEFGGTPMTGATFARPTGYEMASRLSYLLWQSMPDAELFRAADANELGTDAEVLAQAKRMLADPKAHRVYQFFDEWLDTDRLPQVARDEQVFPTFNDTLPTLQAEETKQFIEAVLWKGGAGFKELMTAPYSYVNGALAQHYGVSGVTGTAFARVDMPGRAGLITMGGPLSVHDKATRTSIVLRGLKIRTDFLCQTIGAPPADVVTDLPDITPGLNQRDRLQQHRQVALCASCHDKMDPIGIVLDNFDALGRSRTQDEGGNPINTSSELTHTLDANGPVADAVQLAQRLADSREVRECFATQTFRFFYGRGEKQADDCSLKQLFTAFEKSSYSVQDLLVALTQTDAFLYRPTTVAGQP